MKRRTMLLGAVGSLMMTGDALCLEPVDRSKLVPTFTENFDTPLSIYNPVTGAGRWKVNGDYGDQTGPSSHAVNDGELQVYSDERYNGINPFSIKNGILSITADINKRKDDYKSGARPYTSGIMTTSKSYVQRYGFFEWRGKLPAGNGLWPAFWLIARPNMKLTYNQFPGEIDVMEALGKTPGEYYVSLHWPTDPSTREQKQKTLTVPVNGTTAFHTYAVLWTPTDITWYCDDVPVQHLPNPGLHMPMMIVVNLAIGGDWAGPPDDSTQFPAKLEVDYIRAYQFRDKL